MYLKKKKNGPSVLVIWVYYDISLLLHSELLVLVNRGKLKTINLQYWSKSLFCDTNQIGSITVKTFVIWVWKCCIWVWKFIWNFKKYNIWRVDLLIIFITQQFLAKLKHRKKKTPLFQNLHLHYKTYGSHSYFCLLLHWLVTLVGFGLVFMLDANKIIIGWWLAIIGSSCRWRWWWSGGRVGDGRVVWGQNGGGDGQACC